MYLFGVWVFYLILLFKTILVVSSSFESILSFSLMNTIPLTEYITHVFIVVFVESHSVAWLAPNSQSRIAC